MEDGTGRERYWEMDCENMSGGGIVHASTMWSSVSVL